MTRGRVTGIVANLVSVAVDGPVMQNEICFIEHEGSRLMAEVIRVGGSTAYTQVFESTRGLRAGTGVAFTGALLEATLGPGILSGIFDGLQNDLEAKEGLFLKRGEYTQALGKNSAYPFTPCVKRGDAVAAGDWLGSVPEWGIEHRIMVPFSLEGRWSVRSVAPPGSLDAGGTAAVLENGKGEEFSVGMRQRWPIKRPIRSYRDKPRPGRIMETGVRIIDMFNPIAEGGTGFIPGPFGCGKTVIQHTLSRNADADIIVVTACGERANEVVEIFTDFPEMLDPRTGRKLMERTVIICNTSNMPVAAREASMYTGMTIAEYYRAMGLKVLLLADSTSRWAQALREMSNRMEELPGPDAFPIDLPAVVSNYYARAGVVRLRNGATGSVTFIGTVSPAGGNLKEPVTEATKKAARCFYALSQARADSKRYPAIDPVESYSMYLEYPEVRESLAQALGAGWEEDVRRARSWLLKGRERREQINILGDDGVPVEYHVTLWKAELVDFVLIQQDAFDRVDASTPLERQRYMLRLVEGLCEGEYVFDSYEKVAPYFRRLINTLRQMNYCEYKSERFFRYEKDLAPILAERGG